MLCLIRKFFICKDGATAIEYGLVCGLVAVAIIAGVTSVGDALTNSFSSVDNAIVEVNKP